MKKMLIAAANRSGNRNPAPECVGVGVGRKSSEVIAVVGNVAPSS